MSEEKAKAYQQALNFLAHKPRTRFEIKDKLKSYQEDIVSEILELLESYNYLNDAEYAALYVRERARFGYGPRKIAWELKQRGVEESLIETALSSELPDPVKIAKASLDAKHAGPFFSDRTEKQKAFGYLARRGFDMETIAEVLGEFE